MIDPKAVPIGTQLYSVGLNMQCRPVLAKSSLVECRADGRIVVESDGIKLIDNPADYFLNRAEAEVAVREYKPR